MKRVVSMVVAYVVVASLSLLGCGGSGGGNGGAVGNPTPRVSRGEVEKVGSITVNGVRFDDTAAVVVDDNAAGTIAEIEQEGVVVTVAGSVDDNGLTGDAFVVEIENEAKGAITAIDAINGTVTVLGQTVIVSGETTFGNVANFAALAVGNQVEVHGFRTNTGQIRATRIEVLGADAVDEIRGVISNLIAATSFTVNGMNITMNGSTVIVPTGTVLANGQMVEVHLSGNLATLIDVEDELPGAVEVEVEGLINGFVSLSLFFVNETQVDASGAILMGGVVADLANNVKVEAEGSMVGGVLVATKLQIKDSIRIHDNATGTSATQVTLLGLTVMRGLLTDPNDLIIDGDGVEVRGFINGDGSITATRVIKLSNPVDADKKIIQGPVDSFDAGAKTLVIAGININATGALLPANFFALLGMPGLIVKARGTFAAGTLTANEIEFE